MDGPGWNRRASAIRNLVMDEEVRYLAGERHQQREGRRAHRGGKEDGCCVQSLFSEAPLNVTKFTRRECSRLPLTIVASLRLDSRSLCHVENTRQLAVVRRLKQDPAACASASTPVCEYSTGAL